jgi:hypothetical protein
MALGNRMRARIAWSTPNVIGMAWHMACLSPYALTIESKDMGYVPGHAFNYAAGNYSPIGLDLTEGTGKKWDFSSFTGSGYINYVKIYAVSNIAKFPSATLAIDIESKTIAASSETMYYKEQGGDWLIYGEVASGTATTYAPYIPMGLPHTPGKTWTATYTLSGTSQTQNGKVLVRVQVATSSIYYFETREYGRIGYLTVPNNYLVLMTSGTQNLGVKFHPKAGASGRDILSCAGSTGFLSIESQLAGQIRIYAENGRLFGLTEIEAARPWRMPASSGNYFITFASPRYTLSRSLKVRK